MAFLFKGFLLLYLAFSFCDARGLDIGLCDATTFECQCGSPGYSINIPIKQCLYFYRWKNTCSPCDGVKPDTVCSKYILCQECKVGTDRCISCPPGRYGLWCNGECQCQNGGICDPGDGRCTCLNGFEGASCEIRKGCSLQPALPPVNAEHLSPDVPTIVRYSCPEGYYLKGSPQASCLPSGQWSSPPPQCLKQCLPLSSPSNGGVTYAGEKLVQGTTAVFYCDDPFELIGTQVLTCQEDGLWSSSIPSCQMLTYCPDPGVVKYGGRSVQTALAKGDSFVEGTTIQYSCSEKFLLMGLSKLTCLNNGTWTSNLPSCIKVADKDVNCATVGSSIVSDIGVPVRIQCPKNCVEEDIPVWGTALYTEASSVCRAALHAGKITNIGGAVHVVNNGLYADFIGSEMNGVATKAFQDPSGSFRFDHLPLEYTARTRNEKVCPSGWLQVENYCIFATTVEMAWDKVRTTCNNLGASVPVLENEFLRHSLASAMNQKGIQIVWSSLRRVVNSESNFFYWVTDSNETFPVSPNDTLWGKDEPRDNGDCVVFDTSKTPLFKVSRCSEMKPFACIMDLNLHIIARCEDPGVLENGYYKTQGQISNDFYSGSTVIFHCNDLYYMQGVSSITCSANGTWSDPLPVCVRVPSCERSPPPAYGFVDFQPPPKARIAQPSRAFGSRTARLPVGLNAVLPAGRSQNSTPEVKPDPADNVTFPEGYYRVGSRAEYSCSSRYYQLVGSQTRRCQSDGSWSGRSPACIPICGQTDSPRAPFIVNGNATDIGQWPWQAAIARYIPDFKMWFLLCGGSLINENWIITAAHCVTYAATAIVIEPSEFRIYFGKYYRDDGKDDEYVQIRGVDEIHVHPDYDPSTFDADIALIQLDTPVQLTTRVQPVCLPTDRSTRENLEEGRLGVVTGWGMNENRTYSGTLQQAVLPVVSHRVCEQGYKEENLPLTVTENMFCAGYKRGESDACSGDSGGPIVFTDESSRERRWVLEGIVSWGSPAGCGNPNQYGGFTKVNTFLDWISQYA